jgi:hypothetical protein
VSTETGNSPIQVFRDIFTDPFNPEGFVLLDILDTEVVFEKEVKVIVELTVVAFTVAFFV